MRWLWRLCAALLIVMVGFLAPSAYVELACRGTPLPQTEGRLPPDHRRAEARTLLTYPEWHIVYAYEDYADVIAEGAPHDFGYLRSIAGFWSSFCTLSKQADTLGEDTGGARQTVHVIGVSFTAELLAKAIYEETLGRLIVSLSGRGALDALSAEQAERYAAFLQQVPWYKWDFAADAEALAEATPKTLRDHERALALGLEYRVKAAYAKLIAGAVAEVGADALTLRMIATDLPQALPEGVAVVETTPDGSVLETPRYRALTRALLTLADGGATFVEIAGNDDILVTTLSDSAPAEPGVIASLPRQGSDQIRTLHLVKVPDLAAHLRGLDDLGMTLEHIHDY